MIGALAATGAAARTDDLWWAAQQVLAYVSTSSTVISLSLERGELIISCLSQ